MMTTLGNKKNVKIFSFALAGVFIASVAAMAVAAAVQSEETGHREGHG